MSEPKTGSLLEGLELAQTLAELRQWRTGLEALRTGVLSKWRTERESVHPHLMRPKIALVPTMGALHAGHMALIKLARQDADVVVVSIFVNPLQFGPNEDYSRYPRTLEQDMKLLNEASVDCLFNPSVEELYGPWRSQPGSHNKEEPSQPSSGQEKAQQGVDEANVTTNGAKSNQTMIVPPASLIDKLCGVFRPGHFEGVATVVTKLFNVVEPDYAYFGEKDYQQLLVVKRLVRDLNLKVEVRSVPIVRESDGLALSSRNVYLQEADRKTAPLIYRTLSEVKENIFSRNVSVAEALNRGEVNLSQSGFQVQYLKACHAETLEFVGKAITPMVILCGAKLGGVRLIDNLIVK